MSNMNMILVLERFQYLFTWFETFPPEWKPSHPVGTLSTRMETFLPGWEPFPPGGNSFHPDGNLPTGWEPFPPGWKCFHQKGRHCHRNILNNTTSQLIPAWEGFQPVEKISNQVERFPQGGKVSRPGWKPMLDSNW